MVGITYLVEEDSRIIKERLIEYDNQKNMIIHSGINAL